MFWLCWVFVAVHGFLIVWLLLLRSTGSRCAGFSSCGTQAQQLWPVGSRAQAQYLWCTGLVVPWHVESPRTMARTLVPFIGRQILNHCTTRKAPGNLFLNFSASAIMRKQKYSVVYKIPSLSYFVLAVKELAEEK